MTIIAANQVIGDQFLSNLLIAVRSLIHSIWDELRDGSNNGKIVQCVEAIRHDADGSDPICSPDPIAFMSVFAEILYGIVPRDVARKHEGELYRVMGGLASVVTVAHVSDWPKSRKLRVGWTLGLFWSMGLKDQKLLPKLAVLQSSLYPAMHGNLSTS